MTAINSRRQAGFALVTAIFLLVILAGLAVAVVSLTSTQQNAAAKDELGTRALLAAKAGMQWALFTALQPPGGDSFAKLGCAAAPITFPMPAGTTLSAFSVTITCSAVAAGYGDPANPTTDPTAGHFRITVIACNAAACPAANPGPDYVQRIVTSQL